MAIGALESEADLKRFMERQLADHGAQIRQLLARWRSGTGSPEGVEDAPKSAVYQREDGSPGTFLYVKTTDLGTLTGWTAFA